MSRLRIPPRFCWTRFGTEAGQRIEEIVRRKEKERLANDGLFLWGIGNSVGVGLSELIRHEDPPEVLFSPIKSAPRSIDVRPEVVLAWTTAKTVAGKPYALPHGSLVLSRGKMPTAKRSHYALVCYSPTPLTFDDSEGILPFDHLRNLRSGSPVGPSQVTAVVALNPARVRSAKAYSIAFRAMLADPYFVVLRDPIQYARPGPALF